MNSPSPSGAKDTIVTVILHFHTVASTFEENDSAAFSDRDFFRPLRGSGGVGAGFPTVRHGLRSSARFAGWHIPANGTYPAADAPEGGPYETRRMAGVSPSNFIINHQKYRPPSWIRRREMHVELPHQEFLGIHELVDPLGNWQPRRMSGLGIVTKQNRPV